MKRHFSYPCVWWRVIAAVTLLSWISAIGLCTNQCALGTGHCSSGGHACRQQAKSSPDHDDDHDHGDQAAQSSKKQQHPDQPAVDCLSIKAALTSAKISTPILEASHVLYFLTPVHVTPSTNFVQSSILVRRSRSCERVFTPEECLGPAFRSHAPPLAV